MQDIQDGPISLETPTNTYVLVYCHHKYLQKHQQCKVISSILMMKSYGSSGEMWWVTPFQPLHRCLGAFKVRQGMPYQSNHLQKCNVEEGKKRIQELAQPTRQPMYTSPAVTYIYSSPIYSHAHPLSTSCLWFSRCAATAQNIYSLILPFPSCPMPSTQPLLQSPSRSAAPGTSARASGDVSSCRFFTLLASSPLYSLPLFFLTFGHCDGDTQILRAPYRLGKV